MNFKQKAKHFFHYYKWHIIITVLAILFLGLFLKSCSNSKDADVSVAYISDHLVSDKTNDEFYKTLEENKLMYDINGDGETIFHFDPITISFDITATKDYEIYEKLQVVLSSGSQSVILAHQYILEDYEWAFDDVSAYAKGQDKIFENTSGVVTGISVEGNELLESIGINTENLYVGMHFKNDKQKQTPEYKEALKIFELILENQ